MHTLLHSVPLTLQQATANPHLCQRLLDTHRQVWLSLLWGHCSFLLGPGAHKVLLCPPRVCFPSPREVLSSNPWEFSGPLLHPHFGKSVIGPRIFTTVWELLWYNLSLVCGSSAQWLYSGANGDLLEEDSRHTLHLPGLLHPETLSLWQATTDLCLWRVKNE